MGLKWPILLLPIVIAVGVAVWFAMRGSRRGWQGELPLLARSFRLTTLPEYQRALKLHERLSIAALVLAVIAVLTLAGAAVRPTKTYQPRLAGSDTPYVDIMLCFGPQFSLFNAEQNGMATLMTDFQNRVKDFGNQRIGMTQEFYRAFPVTGDHGWVTRRLSDIAEMTEKYVAAGNDYTRRSKIDTDLFERTATGAQPDAVDTLAMCAVGLPAVGSDNGRGKQLIYIGDDRLGDDPQSYGGGPDKRIYSKDTLKKTIEKAGIQVNAIVPDDMANPAGFVEELVGDSGGQRIRYTEVGGFLEKATPKKQENQKEELTTAVDKILAAPPQSTLDAAREQAMRSFQWDVPDLLLQLALFAAIGLAACRVGMRL
jgi:hypothetical protein